MQFFYKALPWLIVAVMVIIVSIQMKGKDRKIMTIQNVKNIKIRKY